MRTAPPADHDKGGNDQKDEGEQNERDRNRLPVDPNSKQEQSYSGQVKNDMPESGFLRCHRITDSFYRNYEICVGDNGQIGEILDTILDSIPVSVTLFTQAPEERADLQYAATASVSLL